MLFPHWCQCDTFPKRTNNSLLLLTTDSEVLCHRGCFQNLKKGTSSSDAGGLLSLRGISLPLLVFGSVTSLWLHLDQKKKKKGWWCLLRSFLEKYPCLRELQARIASLFYWIFSCVCPQNYYGPITIYDEANTKNCRS